MDKAFLQGLWEEDVAPMDNGSRDYLWCGYKNIQHILVGLPSNQITSHIEIYKASVTDNFYIYSVTLEVLQKEYFFGSNFCQQNEYV